MNSLLSLPSLSPGDAGGEGGASGVQRAAAVALQLG